MSQWRPQARVALLQFAAVGISVVIWGAGLVPLSTGQPDLVLWVVLVAAFAGAEFAQLNVEIRRQTVGMSLSEIPLVLSVFLIGPLATLIVRLVGTSITMIARRDPPKKTVFNSCLFALECSVLFAVLGLFDFGPPSDPTAWLAVACGILAAYLVSLVMVSSAITWTQGWLGWARLTAIMAPLLIVSIINSAIALVILIALDANPRSLLLLAVLGMSLVVLFRSYARSLEEHRTLGQVYGFAKQVEEATLLPLGVAEAVEAVREMLNADRAAIWLSGTDGESRIAFAGAEPGSAAYDGPGDASDPLRERVESGHAGVLFREGESGRAIESGLKVRGATEAIGVPLSSAGESLGYLEVCDRLGDRLEFVPEDVRLLESLATHVSAAAQNLELLRKLRYDAQHDRLTGRPNRLYLTEIVAELLETAEVAETQVAVLIVDLGSLTQVNDTLGHDAGDELLSVAGALLQETAPMSATVGRMGGDEFAVVFPVAHLEEAEQWATTLRDALSVPCDVAGVSVEVNATVGLCIGPLHGSTAASLLQRADVALYAGHAAGQQVMSYQPSMDQSSLRRLHLGTQLREAMLSGQVYVVFQPLVHLATNSIRSAETLVRWQHPRYGAVSPDDFIPLAERIGMINPLTMHVLDLALRQCRSWLDRDMRIEVAVNLSVRTLADASFPAAVAQALAESGVPAALLTFEITESSEMADPVTALPVLHALHALGVKLAIDDFGTGYSSLAYLSKLPVDEVKIDKAFIQNIGTEINDSSITKAIIDLAHGLGLSVVAEGVEDELTRDLLARMDCDTIQGYLLSRPLPGPRLDRWLAVRTAARPGDRDESGRAVYLTA